MHSSIWITLVCEVHVGEALGLLSALEWVHQLYLGPTDFEIDTIKLVDRFSSAHQDVTEFGLIIRNCKTIFGQYYVNSSVEFVIKKNRRILHHKEELIHLLGEKVKLLAYWWFKSKYVLIKVV